MPKDPTNLIDELAAGRSAAAEALFPLVYDELRGLAAAFLARERANHTLQPTALVHEAYLKLIDQTRAAWSGRAHFFAVAAQAIRRILVDHARGDRAQKRGGAWQRITLSDAISRHVGAEVELLALDDALEKLERLSERQARVVQLRYFAGLTEPEVAEVLGVHRSTVADDWAIAKAWLAAELTERGEA